MNADDLRGGTVAGAIRQHRLIAVLRRVQPRERLLALVDELADAGARAFEITFDAPEADHDLAAVRERLAARGGALTIVGAGTILRAEQLDAARDAGAQFAVSPILDVELVRRAVAAGMPCIPGALTPTEMVAAWQAGATFIKLFPASAVGPEFVRELRGPLPEVAVIPTGGVNAANARAFLDAGAVAVGIGGALTRADAAARRALVRSLVAGPA